MKLIAHRGNIEGPQPSYENSPSYILHAMSTDFDVEIDVWFHKNKWYLGHDEPEHPVPFSFIQFPGLWVHAKDTKTLDELNRIAVGVHYFYHENDSAALTSKQWTWTCNSTVRSSRSVLMIPGKPFYECYSDTRVNDLTLNFISVGSHSLIKTYSHHGFGALCNDWVGFKKPNGFADPVLMNTCGEIPLS